MMRKIHSPKWSRLMDPGYGGGRHMKEEFESDKDEERGSSLLSLLVSLFSSRDQV